MSTLLRDTVTDSIQRILDEGGEDVASRIANICETYYESPTGIMEVRGTVKKYGVDADCTKEIAVTLNVLNTQDNRVALAMMADSAVTLRMLQADIEAVGV